MPVKSYPKHLMTSGETATNGRRFVECIADYIKDDSHLNHVNSRERLHPQQYKSLVAEMNAVVTEIAANVRARQNKNDKMSEIAENV